MNRPTCFRAFVMAVVALAAVVSMRADIEFSGIYATSRETHFILRDTDSNRTGWVARGGSFAGWTVVSFDQKDDTLHLRRDTTERAVRLKDAKVMNARLNLTGEIKFGSGSRTSITRVTMFLEQENVFPLGDGLTYRVTPKALPDGTLEFSILVERRNDDGTVEKVAAPRMIVLRDQAFSIQVGDVGFSFNPAAP